MARSESAPTVLPSERIRTTIASARLLDVALLPAFIALLVAGTAGRAVGKPLWHDELFTFYLATQTTVAGLWSALAAAVDLNPPLYHLAVMAASEVTGAGPFATRLPALIGFLAASIALYVFARRRLGTVFALLAALTPSLTGTYMYAYEGRPYGLVLGCSAVALAAWQRRGDTPSGLLAPVLCASMLAAATLSHYYAVLTMLPLAAGELIRTLQRRQVDWPMMLALTCGFVPLVFLRPLIRSAREFAPAFWSPPAAGELFGFYRQLLDPLSVVIAVALGLMAFAFLWAPTAAAGTGRGHAHETGESVRPRLDELAAAVMFLLVPVAGYAVGALVTGAFHERYVLQAVLGLSVLVAWSSAMLVASRRQAGILLTVMFLAFGARQTAGALGLLRQAADPGAEYQAALSSVEGDGQVVVSHALAYLPMTHYLDDRSKKRLTYLTRPADVVQRLGGDTASRALLRLSRVVPLDVREYEAFLRDHRQFYVYGPKSWLIPRLRAQNADVRLLREYEEAALYAVDVQGDDRP